MTRMLAATPQIAVPSWVIAVVLLLAFLGVAVVCAVVLNGFRWAVRAGTGDTAARDRWLVVLAIEVAVGVFPRTPRWLALVAGVVALQVLTYVVARRAFARPAATPDPKDHVWPPPPGAEPAPDPDDGGH